MATRGVNFLHEWMHAAPKRRRTAGETLDRLITDATKAGISVDDMEGCRQRV